FTKITFIPDLEKFHMKLLDDMTVGLMKRRVFDMCGTLNEVTVFLNGQKIEVAGFDEYSRVFFRDSGLIESDDGSKNELIYSKVNERWQVAVARSDYGFQQISFVNNILTNKGGRHVDHVVDQLVVKIKEAVNLQVPKHVKAVRPLQIKNRLIVFVNCLIENPMFDSQAKEYLTTTAHQFGSKCVITEDFMRRVLNETDLIDSIVCDINKREPVVVNRSIKRSLMDLPKLEDATAAGTKESSQCTLIITEGDSAKALAVAGLSVVGREHYGVFPIRGKLTNVCDLSMKAVLQNEEISAIIRILGLKFDVDYSTKEKRDELRYGHVMIMTDQDSDGAHIKGLIVNFLYSFWPSLIRSDFIKCFITPLIKVCSFMILASLDKIE
ncbi:hypothetical protein AB6A40_010662, partial [Gnathostoma spinigerum]